MDLQVDLHAAKTRKRLFCVPDQPGAQAVAALLRIDGDRIQPAAMPVIAGKEGADHLVIRESNEEQMVVDSQFLVDRQVWAIVRHVVIEDGLPQLDDREAVMRV